VHLVYPLVNAQPIFVIRCSDTKADKSRDFSLDGNTVFHVERFLFSNTVFTLSIHTSEGYFPLYGTTNDN